MEGRQLEDLYGADPHRVDVVHPGVDLEIFTPGSKAEARARLGIDPSSPILLFVGRIQPLKAPDVLVRAAAELVRNLDHFRDLTVVICGGPSGSGLDRPTSLIDLTRELGIEASVRFEAPGDRSRLADWYRSADLTVVPSHSESFGLVAVESQACGTPVVAAAVGGLPTAVADGVSGVLVAGHDPRDYAHTINQLLTNPLKMRELQGGARMHASTFGWQATTAELLDTYRSAIADYQAVARVAARQ